MLTIVCGFFFVETLIPKMWESVINVDELEPKLVMSGWAIERKMVFPHLCGVVVHFPSSFVQSTNFDQPS